MHIEFDMHDKSVNLLNNSTLLELKQLIKTANSDKNVYGVIISSKKEHFCLGADVPFILRMIKNHPKPQDLYEKVWEMQSLLSNFKKPTVCIVHGQCLGGGLELALACHYRIGISGTKLRLGLPEVRLGIMPGLGGTQRLPRLIGLEPALNMLLKGTTVREDIAAKQGLIDELATTKNQALHTAKALLQKKTLPNDKAVSLYKPEHVMTLSAAFALTKKQSQGCYTNVENLLQAIYEGHLVDLDNGLKTETEYFVKTLLEPTTQNMIKTLYIDRQHLRKQAKKSLSTTPITTLGVIGGGFMGAGIAAHALQQGLNVVIIEQNNKALQLAKTRLDELQQKYPPGKIGKLTISTDMHPLKTCQVVIEAVYEDMALKQNILQQAEHYLDQKAILASNTSTIPITHLASVLKDPTRFVGIHFFSPVAKMQLIEIIQGQKTQLKTLDIARGLTAALNKVPITVKDTRGFYTSQIVMGYIFEAITLITEGANPIEIEHAARQIGMPTPPLALLDEIGIDIAWHIIQENHKDPESPPLANAAIELINELYSHTRLGRKTQQGFYSYQPEKHLWPEILHKYPAKEHLFEDLKKRLLNIQVTMAHTIHQQGLIKKEDANVGAILGLGFCPWSGGPMFVSPETS